MSVVFSNIFFLAIRSFTRHKIQLDKVPQRLQLPGVDTIVAIKDVASDFNSHFIPLFMSWGVIINQWVYPILIIRIANVISAILITILIFVSWKKGGPTWWTPISHKVFFVLLIVDYLVIPLIVLLTTLIYFSTYISYKEKNILESFLILFPVLFMFRMFEFFTYIRHQVIAEAQIYLKLKTEVESKNTNEL